VISSEHPFNNVMDNPSWVQPLSVLEQNPLPAAYVLQLYDQNQAKESISDLVSSLEAIPTVEQVLLDIDWLHKLETLLEFARQALLFLSLGVILIVIGTVFNTIRLQALNHQEEIAVARLVGATEDFVRRPFLYFGALIGDRKSTRLNSS